MGDLITTPNGLISDDFLVLKAEKLSNGEERQRKEDQKQESRVCSDGEDRIWRRDKVVDQITCAEYPGGDFIPKLRVRFVGSSPFVDCLENRWNQLHMRFDLGNVGREKNQGIVGLGEERNEGDGS